MLVSAPSGSQSSGILVSGSGHREWSASKRSFGLTVIGHNSKWFVLSGMDASKHSFGLTIFGHLVFFFHAIGLLVAPSLRVFTCFHSINRHMPMSKPSCDRCVFKPSSVVCVYSSRWAIFICSSLRAIFLCSSLRAIFVYSSHQVIFICASLRAIFLCSSLPDGRGRKFGILHNRSP